MAETTCHHGLVGLSSWLGGQQPRLSLSRLPAGQQVDAISMPLGQPRRSQPDAITGLTYQIAEGLPRGMALAFRQVLGFLAQHIAPLPLVQLAKHLHGSKFTITDHQNLSISGNEPPDIGQQRQVLVARTVPTLASHPGPSDGDGSSIVATPGILSAIRLRCTERLWKMPTSIQAALRRRVTRSAGRSCLSRLIQV
jgi:hypothetical protein